MFRKLAILALVGSSLAACSAAQVALTASIEAQIQAAIIQQCNYSVPALEQIAAVASTFIPGASSVTALVSATVNAVCSAVATAQIQQPKLSLAGTSLNIVVNGVQVNGRLLSLSSRHR